MLLDEKKLPERYFEKICSIPHPSGYEKELSDYIVSQAKELGYEYYQDELYNVIVKVPATPGFEDHEPIMLSGHMDMVPTKTKGHTFDFTKDPLELYLDGRILRAKNTTLGADDGVATAYMLSLMNDPFDHPLIECVFTVQEEVGCCGSSYIDTSKLVSKRLIGLDTAGEHEVTVGNYCSDLITFTHSYQPINETKQGYLVKLNEIDAYYVRNEIYDHTKCAIQYLASILSKIDCNIVSMSGGVAENFPAQNCQAVIITDQDLSTIEGITYESLEVEYYYSKEATKNLFDFILAIPNGAKADEEGILLESYMLGKISYSNNEFSIIGSSRCQNADYNSIVEENLRAICNQYGFNMSESVRYRSWKYVPYSPLRENYRKLAKEYLGKDLVEVICPGGLEISDFLYKMGELDVLSIGPLTGGFHTPEEWLDLDSFNRIYEMIKLLINL